MRHCDETQNAAQLVYELQLLALHTRKSYLLCRSCAINACHNTTHHKLCDHWAPMEASQVGQAGSAQQGFCSANDDGITGLISSAMTLSLLAPAQAGSNDTAATSWKRQPCHIVEAAGTEERGREGREGTQGCAKESPRQLYCPRLRCGSTITDFSTDCFWLRREVAPARNTTWSDLFSFHWPRWHFRGALDRVRALQWPGGAGPPDARLGSHWARAGCGGKVSGGGGGPQFSASFASAAPTVAPQAR